MSKSFLEDVPSLGFIGTGAITAAMVTGLSRFGLNAPQITVSPRNQEIGLALARQFPNVSIADSNQQVVENSDVVILAVRPIVALEVLMSLSFKAEQQLISLVSGMAVETLQRHTAPLRSICLAVPLPSVAWNSGVTAVYLANPIALGIFEALGSVLPANEPKQFQALCAVTGTIATFYSLAGSIVRWLVSNDLSALDASRYVSAMLTAMFSSPANGSSPGFDILIKEHVTQGGLNEEFLQRLTALHMQDMFIEGLDGLRQRLIDS